MEEIIKLLNEKYRLDTFKMKDNIVVFSISSSESELICPYCGKPSNKVHSSYDREIQDLPMQDKKVILLVKTRKMFCKNKKCNKKTFSERHCFVEPRGKKTLRLEKKIIYTSTQLSAISASRILQASNIDVSKSSICMMLKKNAINCG